MKRVLRSLAILTVCLVVGGTVIALAWPPAPQVSDTEPWVVPTVQPPASPTPEANPSQTDTPSAVPSDDPGPTRSGQGSSQGHNHGRGTPVEPGEPGHGSGRG